MAVNVPDSAAFALYGPLAELAKPLLEESLRLDAEIKKLDLERAAVLEQLRPIRSALQKLAGWEPAKSAKKKAGRPAVGASRTGEVLAFIESHDGYKDGFNYTWVFTSMKNEGISIGKEMVKRAVDELHSTGVLRFDRTTSGGGKIYKLVGDGV